MVRAHFRRTKRKVAHVRRHHRKSRHFSSIRIKLTPEQVDEFIKSIKKDDVIIPGIGKFKVKKVAAKKGGVKKIFPATGKEYTTKAKPASRKLKFFASKQLKEVM